jgi:N-acyl-D-aspartate/D-glutamate deacylase
LEDQRVAMRDPDLVRRLVQAGHAGSYGRALGNEAPKPEFQRLHVLQRPLPPNPTVAELAAERGADPIEVMIQLALETDLDQFFFQAFMPADHEATLGLLRHPLAVMAFSDSGAHVTKISDASIQTHLLGHWVRNRQLLTLEEAVRMLTLSPARAWGFHDRGLLREGLAADINVFDPETVGPAMPFLSHDLPGGEPRITQKSLGFLATLVGGEVVISNGEHTGATPGRLIRGSLGRTLTSDKRAP